MDALGDSSFYTEIDMAGIAGNDVWVPEASRRFRGSVDNSHPKEAADGSMPAQDIERWSSRVIGGGEARIRHVAHVLL